MAPPRFAYVRDVVNMPAVSQLVKAGLVPLLNADDPNLIQGWNTAASAGVTPGLWAAANARSPQEYAAMWAKVLGQIPHPAWMDFNIEFAGKGYPGTSGYNYTEQFLNDMQPYLKPDQFSVSPMGRQTDFNYPAALKRGGYIFPQAYTGNMTLDDPQAIVDYVTKTGVPRDRVVPILGRGATGYGNLWAVEDWNGNYPTVNAPAPTRALASVAPPPVSVAAPQVNLRREDFGKFLAAMQQTYSGPYEAPQVAKPVPMGAKRR